MAQKEAAKVSFYFKMDMAENKTVQMDKKGVGRDMSILIKGMEMPGGCRQCEFCRFGGVHCELNVCRFTGQGQDSHLQGRMTDCPLIEIPDGHGDLIDRDWMLGNWFIYLNPRTMIEDAPTVIPADKDGET